MSSNKNTLFRREALSGQRTGLVGDVTMMTPLRISVISGFFAVLFACGILFLILGQYHRRETVSGILMPSGGLIKVYPAGPGVITRMFVEENQAVVRGQRLAAVSGDRALAGGESAATISTTELQAIQDTLEKEIRALPKQKQLARQRLQSERETLITTLEVLTRKQELLRKRTDLAADKLRRSRELRNARLLSENRFREVHEALLMLQQEEAGMEEIRLAKTNRKTAVELEIRSLDPDFDGKESSLQIRLAQNRKQLAASELEKEQVLLAPYSGTVTALQIAVGRKVSSSRPALTILPEGSRLEARLYVPSRAIGFIGKDQKVRLRFAAFPWQKFGVRHGSIAGISRSVLNPGELSDSDHLTETGPVYKVRVALEKDSITAFGRSVPLQAGMALQADILLEERSLLEWLMEPLHRLKG